jgi:hypothetical protein
MKWSNKWQVGFLAGGVALVLIGVMGVTGGARKTEVTGKVTYKGKPVVYGAVILVSPDGLAAAAGPIQPDGTYTVAGMKPGEVRVGVISRDPTAQQRQHNQRWAKITRPVEQASFKAKVDRKKWFSLPPKFEEPETSGVSFTLKGGQQDIVLE